MPGARCTRGLVCNVCMEMRNGDMGGYSLASPFLVKAA